MARLCVFCGSQMGVSSNHRQLAAALGRALAERGIGVVTGGGQVGLMGAVASGALAGGGEVIGIIPKALNKVEVAHEALSRLEVVPDMHIRKARMAELSDGFVALPGGIGTLEELFEVLTWRQLGFHDKPVFCLAADDYWKPLGSMLDHMQEAGFLYPTARELLIEARSLEELLSHSSLTALGV